MITSTAQRDAIQLARQVLQQRPVYLDTETTGLDKTAEIIEISIIDTDGSTLVDTLVRPSLPIPQDASRINHITSEMVQKAQPWPFLWNNIKPSLNNRVVVIYNADFDIRMLKQTHDRYKMRWDFTGRAFDLMSLYAKFNGDWDPNRRTYRNISLENAGKHCHIPLPNAHRALADTLLTRALLEYLANIDM
jgi:DNA polymerase III epsilon subunit-like protein